MGVPGFFSWLIKQYKEGTIVIDNIPSKPRALYIDANCLFHPQCFKILEGMIDEKNIDKLENKMIQRILNYIDFLIGYTDPQELVYISVDGVAPLAKINQQRKRRFKTISDNLLKEKIKKKYGLKTNNVWSNTVITPGTDFMEKLHTQLLRHLNTKKRIKIIYSSYHTIGEGEHKILQHIKKYNSSGPIVIYGLDADLFFLSMASQKNNIYLLRENTHFSGVSKNVNELYDLVDDVTEELKFVSIDTIKEKYNETIRDIILTKLDKLNEHKTINVDIDFCNDFVFLCYLLGNDFLPHFPSIDIKHYGLDYILDSYAETFIFFNKNLINIKKNNVKINVEIFCDLIRRLGEHETIYFTEMLPEIKHKLKHKQCPKNISDDYEKEMWNIENMKYYKIDDPVRLGIGGTEDWKFRYYEHYFNTIEHQNKVKNEVCYSYLEGLKWTTLYYFCDCPSWTWQYVYTHAPFISDLSQILTNIDINTIKFESNASNTPFTPCSQLLSVLPPFCKNLLPHSYRDLVCSINSQIIDLFPEVVEIDMINKDLYWQCVPKIPTVSIDRIMDAVKNLKLTDSEKIKNMVCDDFFINFK